MADRNGALEKLQDQLKESFSYLDVLAWAVAMTNSNQFIGDSRKWSKVVRELRAQYPDLLDGIWFTERGFSEQLEDFFRVMARAGALSFMNPRYETIEMPALAIDSINRDVPPGLRLHEEKVREISRRIGELAVA